MKRIFAIASILIFAAVSSRGQGLQAPNVPNFPGVIFRWDIGYAGQPGNLTIPAPVINTLYPSADAFGNLTSINTAGATPQAIHSSFGRGFNVGFQLGYTMNINAGPANIYLGILLGAKYQQSDNISAYQQTIFYQPDSNNNPTASGGYLDNQISAKSQSVTLTPSISFACAKPKWKVYPYVRAGIVLPVWTQINYTLNMTLDGAGASNTSYNAPYFIGAQTYAIMQTNGAFVPGFAGAVGVTWRPANFINLFAELGGQYLTLKATSTTITQWNADGYDMLPYRGAYRDQFNYVGSLNSHSNNAQYNSNYNPNAPKQDISPRFPYSNIGFNVGVQLVLNKKIFKDYDGFDQDRTKHDKPTRKKKKKAEEVKPATTN